MAVQGSQNCNQTDDKWQFPMRPSADQSRPHSSDDQTVANFTCVALLCTLAPVAHLRKLRHLLHILRNGKDPCVCHI